jgi:hypothetical protein
MSMNFFATFLSITLAKVAYLTAKVLECALWYYYLNLSILLR